MEHRERGTWIGKDMRYIKKTLKAKVGRPRLNGHVSGDAELVDDDETELQSNHNDEDEEEMTPPE